MARYTDMLNICVLPAFRNPGMLNSVIKQHKLDLDDVIEIEGETIGNHFDH